MALRSMPAAMFGSQTAARALPNSVRTVRPYHLPTASGRRTNFPDGIAIDGSGNVWVASTGNVGTSGNGSVTELAPTGSALSPASGFTGGGLSTPTCIAINGSGNVWVWQRPQYLWATQSTPGVTELNPTGSALLPVNGFTGGGLNGPFDIAIDGSGNVWVVNFQSFISELNPTGSALSPASGFTGGGLSSPGPLRSTVAATSGWQTFITA